MRPAAARAWVLAAVVLAAVAAVPLVVVGFTGDSADMGAGAVARCTGDLATDYACHQERYRTIVRDAGVAPAMAELKKEYTRDDFVRGSCHVLAHDIGRLAGERRGDAAAVFAEGGELCSAGYYHGAMEALARRLGAARILARADGLCAPFQTGRARHAYRHYACAHGIGHGFMELHGNRLFRALATCDALADDWEGDRCQSGVFMENFIARDDGPPSSRRLRPDDPLYPCTEIAARYKWRCYEVQVQHAARAEGDRYDRAFALCEGVEARLQAICAEGLGNYGAGQSIRQNITSAARTAATEAICQLGPDRVARASCVVGAAKNFVAFYEGIDEARRFCEALEDRALHRACRRAAERAEAYRRTGGPGPQAT